MIKVETVIGNHMILNQIKQAAVQFLTRNNRLSIRQPPFKLWIIGMEFELLRVKIEL